MKTKNIILIALLVLLTGLASCKKDHDIPTGKVFNGGSGGGSTTDSLTISVTANPSEGGTVSGGGTYQQGQQCTLTAVANANYSFSNWTEDGIQVSASANYTFTVDGNRNLVANFRGFGGGTGKTVLIKDFTGARGVNCPAATEYAHNLQHQLDEDHIFIMSVHAGYLAQPMGNFPDFLTDEGTAWYNNHDSNPLFAVDHVALTDGNTFNEGQIDAPVTAALEEEQTFEIGVNPFYDEANRQLQVKVQAIALENLDGQFYITACLVEDHIIGWQTIPGDVDKEYDFRNVFRGTLNGAYGEEFGSSHVNSNDNYNFNYNCEINADFNADECYLIVYVYDKSQGDKILQTAIAKIKQSGSSNFTVSVSANPSDGGTVTGGGIYQQGQTCTVTATANNGYAFIGWYEMISDEGGGSYVPVFSDANYSFTVNGDRTLRADFTYNGGSTTPEGAIDGKFTIDDNGNKVYFSHGNLQYNAVQGTHMCADGTTKPGTWQFAAHQYEIVGNTNSGIGEYYDGWIDLFGWGTSGYNNPSDPYNVNYYPWSTSWETVSEIYNYYGYGPSTNMLSPSLMDSSKNYDWGMYNVIYGAGNQPNQWRTLTSEEWVYVFKKRSTFTGIRYAKAQIIGLSGGESIIGMILLPDDWSTNYYTLNNTDQFQANFTSNIIEVDTWENSLESHGAVFLPASGYRSETSVSYVNHYGEYWSATYSDSSSAYYVHIGHSDFTPQSSNYKRYHGFSVRLVCSAQ